MKITRASDTVFKIAAYSSEAEWREAFPTPRFSEHPDYHLFEDNGWMVHDDQGAWGIALKRDNIGRVHSLTYAPVISDDLTDLDRQAWRHVVPGEGPTYAQYYDTLPQAIQSEREASDIPGGYRNYPMTWGWKNTLKHLRETEDPIQLEGWQNEARALREAQTRVENGYDRGVSPYSDAAWDEDMI